MKWPSIVFVALISLCVLWVVEGRLPNEHKPRWCPNDDPLLDHSDGRVKCNSRRPCPNGYSCWDQSCCPTTEVTYTTSFRSTTVPDCGDNMILLGTECIYFDTCIQLGCPFGSYCLVQNVSIGNKYLLGGSCVQQPCWNGIPLTGEHGITKFCKWDSLGRSECPDEYTCTPIQNDVEGRSVCCISPSTTVTSI